MRCAFHPATSAAHIVEIAVGERERIAALRRHHPELVPLLSQIRRVDDALAVRRKIRTRLPCGFFVVNLARFGAGLRFHPPEAAGAVNVSAIRDEENFRPVRRPGRADLMIELAVVIARQIAAVLSGQAVNVCQFAVCGIRPTKIWKCPLNEVETNAIRLPSGEKRGSTLTAPPCVSCCVAWSPDSTPRVRPHPWRKRHKPPSAHRTSNRAGSRSPARRSIAPRP